MSDPELIHLCRSEYPTLVGMLRLYCRDPFIAEELAQEALARAWASWPKVRRLDSPPSWLRRVAINLANSHLRSAGAYRRARARLEAMPRTVSAEDQATTLSVRDAVASLPRRQRTAVILRYYLDLPFEEVARTMDVPVPTAKSLVRRAVHHLRDSAGLIELEGALDVS